MTSVLGRIGDTAVQRAERVLVVAVDEGLFGIHLDWAEAVYRRDEIRMPALRIRRGPWERFVLHHGLPAFVTDLRLLFDLGDPPGDHPRPFLVVVRAGSHHLALQVDECLGVQELSLDTALPVPSSMTRDDGLCVGHLVSRPSGLLMVLDPSRLLGSAMRETLEPAVREARTFAQRETKMAALWKTIVEAPVVADLRNYARLSRRNGRPRTAAAIRTLVKHVENAGGAGTSGVGSEELLRDLVGLAVAGRTGACTVFGGDGPAVGTILLRDGRVIDAEHRGEWGRGAFRRLLTPNEYAYRFEAGDVDTMERISEPTLALLISSFEDISGERTADGGE